MTPARQVILCDESGRPTGSADIHEAHSGKGQLHLAFSVYVLSPDRQKVLIQQRSAEKRLWPLAWANTCCSHPREGETSIEAGQRRLREELGMTCDLSIGSAFVYRAEDPAGRGVEHEYDVILVGTATSDPIPDPAEVAEWKWIEIETLRRDMEHHPERYAPWFHQGLARALDAALIHAN